MGGIVETNISVKCDVCEKVMPVSVKKQIEFYREYEGVEDDKSMFAAMLQMPGGKTVNYDFAFVCPVCAEKLAKALEKVVKPVAKKRKPRTKKEKPTETKTETKTKPKAKVKNPEPEPEPVTEPDPEDQGLDYDDMALYE